MESITINNTIKPDLKGGIKGWLILPVLALIVQPLSFIRTLIGFVQAVNPFRISLNIYILVYDIFVTLLTLHVAYFFFKKKSITPMYFIIYRIVIFIPWVFLYFIGGKYPLTAASQANLVQPLIAHTLGLLIFIPYFVFSKRVKATFNQPLEVGNRIEGMLEPIQPFFLKLEVFLRKAGKFLIPLVLVFIILTFFLGILITA